jgi:hypothetical protein
LFPVPFEGVHRVEPYKLWDNFDCTRPVASTQALLAELEDLLGFLGTLPELEEKSGQTPVHHARAWIEELRRICQLSVEHRLPVIFYG